ncbi:uncharacterized protein LOC127851388 [Dreissena polymorpha]|uniref:Asl1-like glycosyl hydrolase catalytic domain-containing protein n=1 Tax=Dreissena polymorpha TaxID=45954 RepID=A0A9D4DA12_DREPO|nr:uncharacterized protein LOC127851388 [Dreissena polymorpha]KAH3741718.1 hypothetical protein DPMN_048443 [Dreissena polymorpha]
MLILLALFALAPSVVENASQKKGLAIDTPNLMCDDFRVMTGVSWWYDWGQNYDQFKHACPHHQSPMPQFVPMVWGRKFAWNIQIPGGSQFVLGFNEPDHGEQAKMSPEEAARLWRNIERAAPGVALVAPAPALHNFEWLDPFFQHCQGCRIDYVAAHTYFCSADETMNYLERLWNRYHKRIWLTEFACAKTGDIWGQYWLMKTLLPRLEAAHYVFRYSWFMGRLKRDEPNGWIRQSASLFEAHSSTLTMIGRFYNDF